MAGWKSWKEPKLAFDDSKKADYWQEYAFALMLMNRDEEMRQWAKKAAPWNADAEIIYAVYMMSKAAQAKDVSLFPEINEHLLHAVNSPQKKRKTLEGAAYSTLAENARVGFGMEKNMEQSYCWICKAAELGYEEAQKELSRYHKKLFGGYSYR